MKKILILLLASFTLMGCEFLPSDDSDPKEPTEVPKYEQTVKFNYTITAFQQKVLSESQENRTQRVTSNSENQILTGELTVTNKTSNTTEKHEWSVYVNSDNLAVTSNTTILLDVAAHDFQLTLTKDNQQYVGSVSNFDIVDGTNDVSMTIRPVIGDTITDINLVDNMGTIQFQYDKAELSKFTAPKLGIAIDGGAESIYAIDPATGLVGNYLNLAEGEHKIELKFYEGDTQLAKSDPAQETFNVTLGNNITLDLIPLEGETSFTLTANGSDAKFKLNLPTALVTEAGGKENLEAQMSIVGPKNPIREITLTVNSELDASGDTVYFAETTLENYHYDTISYTVIFSDQGKSPKEELAKCVKENVTLTQTGNTAACSITMKRAGISTGNLYASLAINVFNASKEPLSGVKIKANDQLIGITGSGTFGTPGYLKTRLLKGNYKIKAEDIGFIETDVTVDALDRLNINLTLDQNLAWNFVDGGGENGINRDPSQNAYRAELTVSNGKLYSIWQESNGTANQIRVAVYNGNDVSPTWSLIDGDGINGLNKNPGELIIQPQLASFNNKLYAAWYEGYNGTFQIRVAVYNGNEASPSWSFVDGDQAYGLNKDATQKAFWPRLITLNNKLYAIWSEFNGSTHQTRAAVFNGDDQAPSWSFVDGSGVNGINKDPARYASKPEITVFQNKLYAIWPESDGSADQIRVSVYNGNDQAPSWSIVDGNGVNGLNRNPDNNAGSAQLIVFNGKLYSAWRETKASSDSQIYLAVYNGDDSSPVWKTIEPNGDYALSQNGRDPELAVFNNRLHLIMRSQDQEKQQIHVSVYNGDDSSPYWRAVNGNGQTGINKDSNQSASWPQFTAFNNKLYAAWAESNSTASQIRIAVASY